MENVLVLQGMGLKICGIMDTRTKLLDILTTVLGKDVDESCSAETVESWDSLTHIEIIVTVEEEFGIKIPQAKIQELKSFKKLLETIQTLC